MGVILRPAERGDRDGVISLWRAAELTRPWNDPVSDYDLALESSASTILIATAETRIVGSVMTGFDGHRGWVYYLATLPEWRKRGIARKLMQASESWLKERDSPKIQLMVRTDNGAARGFYEALGYEVQDVVTIGRRLD